MDNKFSQLLAMLFEWLKFKDPRYFAVAQTLLGVAVIYLKDVDISGYNEHLQLLLIGVMAYTSTSTKNHLSENHPAKQKINAEIYKKADDIAFKKEGK